MFDHRALSRQRPDKARQDTKPKRVPDTRQAPHDDKLVTPPAARVHEHASAELLALQTHTCWARGNKWRRLHWAAPVQPLDEKYLMRLRHDGIDTEAKHDGKQAKLHSSDGSLPKHDRASGVAAGGEQTEQGLGFAQGWLSPTERSRRRGPLLDTA